MLAVFLMPGSPSINIKNNQLSLKREKNEAFAQTATPTTIQLKYWIYGVEKERVQVTIRNTTAATGGQLTTYLYNADPVSFPNKLQPLASVADKDVVKPSTASAQSFHYDFTKDDVGAPLKEKTDYWFLAVISDGNNNISQTIKFTTSTADSKITVIGQTPVTAEAAAAAEAAAPITAAANTPPDLKLGCSLVPFRVDGCVAEIVHFVWLGAALIMKIAAYFLDFLLYFSTNDSSYKNTFISQGWALVRDIANIFFIISLIFVALRTVLGIHAAEAKKTIGFVIIFGLLINFSLFFTEVVIDASNILAKVFYNSMTVDTKTGSSGQAVDEGGQKSISQALVSKFNPQNLMSQEVYDASEGTIKYVVITLALIAIALFTAMIFFTVGLLFLLRIVTLWIAMIFSPIAFASFATPFKIPGMGHEEWWKDLSQAAFMAPMFVFFLYIIIMFANVMQSVGKAAGGTGGELPQMLLGTIIPFLILYGLLSKAKTTAVKMSGEFGEMVAKAGKSIGGLAVGGAVMGGMGLAAAGGRATLGKLGSKLKNSSLVKDNYAKNNLGGWLARRGHDVGSATSSASFDVRGIKAVGGALAGAGLTGGMLAGALKAKEGGIDKMRADKKAKRQKMAAELAVGPDEKEAIDLRAVEGAHQKLLTDNEFNNAHEIEQQDKRITVLRKRADDAGKDERLASSKHPITGAQGGATNPLTGNTFAEDARLAKEKVKDEEGELLARKNASVFLRSDGNLRDFRKNTTDGTLSADALPGINTTANAAKNAVSVAKEAVNNTQIAQAEQEVKVTIEKIDKTRDTVAEKAKELNATIVAWNTNRDASKAPELEKAMNAAKIAHENSVKEFEEATNASKTAAEKLKTISNDDKAKAEIDTAKAKVAEAEKNYTQAEAIRQEANATKKFTGRSINNLEDTDIPDAHHHFEHKSKQRTREFADYIESSGNLWVNGVMSLGQHSVAGAHESAHALRMGAKADSGHGGKGGH